MLGMAGERRLEIGSPPSAIGSCMAASDLSNPIAVDEAVLDRADAALPLAPLHQPHNMSGIVAAMPASRRVPQVACFDTAFHRSHPLVNDTFALPRDSYDEGIRATAFTAFLRVCLAAAAQFAPRSRAGT